MADIIRALTDMVERIGLNSALLVGFFAAALIVGWWYKRSTDELVRLNKLQLDYQMHASEKEIAARDRVAEILSKANNDRDVLLNESNNAITTNAVVTQANTLALEKVAKRLDSDSNPICKADKICSPETIAAVLKAGGFDLTEKQIQLLAEGRARYAAKPCP